MIMPADLRQSLGLAGLGDVTGAGGDGGAIVLSIKISVFETNKPQDQCKHDYHAQINEAGRTHMRVEFETNQNLPHNHRKDEAENYAHHPCWKIGPENINCRRMSIHFSWWVEGAGLAKSPALNASAAKLV
jgi:hypothetical protein